MPPILADILTLAGGILLLLLGGDVLVRGSVTIAARLGVSTVLIGMTVVAFGTSAPELAFNLTAALKPEDNDALSFGNVVGSNIANIGLILGLACLIRPMKVHASVVKREVPLMIAVSGALAAFFAVELGGVARELSRPESAVMVGVFGAFLVYTTAYVLKGRRSRADQALTAVVVEEVSEADANRPLWRAAFYVLAGLGALVFGGNLAESGAVGLAAKSGMGKELIGVTIVAVATSLPELAASLVAAKRGHADLAVGNVVGSNIFNLLLILGVTGLVDPVALPATGWVTLAVMLALSAALVPMSRTFNNTVSRVEGGVLLALYAAYIGYEIVRVVVA